MLVLLALFACEKEEPLDTGDPPDTLEVPSLDGVDLVGLYEDAVRTALQADARTAWGGHAAAMARIEPGCPDVFVGPPDLDVEGLDEDARGLSWADHCQRDDLRFGGFAYWENDVRNEIVESLPEVNATRMLFGDGVVGEGDAVLFEFDGGAEDVLRVEATDGQVSYRSAMDATVTGTAAFPPGSAFEGGYRTDMYLDAAIGPQRTSLEATGNVYFFEHRLAERFDSVAVDLYFAAEQSLGPFDCAIEPRGWIGVRDPDAYWYDVVFEPRYDENDSDYEPDPYTGCDGCGMLYVRGIPQGELVCPDLSFLWDDGAIVPPEPEEFVLSLRDTLEDP